MNFRKNDTIILAEKNTPHYITKDVNIIEKRQSSADDARLLKELEKEAEKKIDSIVYKKINSLDMSYAEVEISLLAHKINTKMIGIYYKINEREYKHEFEYEDYAHLREYDKLDKIFNLVAKDMAEVVFEPILTQLSSIRSL